MCGGSARSDYGGSADRAESFARDQTERDEYERDTNAFLDDLLKDYNNRDVERTRRRVEDVQSILQDELEGSVPLSYGGSVKKHTYVDGLSDVDLLASIGETKLADRTPQGALRYMERVLRDRMPANVDVKAGQMAVTLTYPDGSEIQVLPSIRTATGVRLPSSRSPGEWSNVVRPEAFARELTEANTRCGGGVVPTVKLFKGLQDRRIQKEDRLTGYHVEAIAAEAFRDYSGGTSRKEMLRHLIQSASSAVMTPLRDSTGQSTHVDEYLGREGGTQRARTAAVLRNLDKSLHQANMSRDRAAWERMYADEE